MAVTLPFGKNAPEEIYVDGVEYTAVSGYSAMQGAAALSENYDAVSALPFNRYANEVGVYLYDTTDKKMPGSRSVS